VRSFSPFHGFSAVPLGYCIGSPEVLENLRLLTATRRFSSLIAGAALQSLKDRGFIRRTFSYIAKEKRFVMQRLSATKRLTVIDSGGNLLLLPLGPGQGGAAAFCERRGILIEEFEDAFGRVYLSFPIGRHRYNAALVNTLKRFAEAHDE
jgi:histidinol-phosphate/aromatic aminotransferase/cobyric acid decarboxylase-like protein